MGLNTKGYTLVEVLVAALVFGITALGVGASYLFFSQSREKAALVSQATSLEVALVEALLNPEVYTDTNIKASLAAGSAPTGLVFRLPQSITTQPVSFGLNELVKLKPALNVNEFRIEPCNQQECPFQFKVSMSRVNDKMAFGYAFQVNSPTAQFMYIGGGDQPRGEDVATYEFASDDFNLFIPYENYLTSLQSSCLSQNSENNFFIGARGYRRDSAQVLCLNGPTQNCGIGEIAKALRIKPGTNEIEFVCEPLSQIKCPDALYSLADFSPASLDAGAMVSGTCVYSLAEQGLLNLPENPTPGRVLTNGKVCPPNYRLHPSSTATPVATLLQAGTSGDCASSNCFGWQASGMSTWQNPATGPATEYCSQETYSCTQWGTSVAPQPPSIQFQINSPSPGHFTLTTVPTPQRCGARWDGYIRVDLVCELDPAVSRTQTAVKGP